MLPFCELRASPWIAACRCLQDFADKADEVCVQSVDDIGKVYKKVQGENTKFLCLDLTYCHVMLTQVRT